MNNIQKDSIQNKINEQKDNDEYSRNFARIPNMLFVSYKHLTKEEKFLYCTLKSVYWDAKPRYVSLRELSELTNYSTGALSKMIPRLQTCGLVHYEIRREQDKQGREYGNAKFNITILDIWELNRQYFSCSPNERDLLDPSLKLVHENTQACSPNDTSSFTKSDKPVHENRQVRAQSKLTKESRKTSLKTNTRSSSASTQINTQKSAQHSIPTQITDSTSKGRSSTNTHESEKENATTTTDIDKISPDIRRKMQKLLTPDERVWFEEIWCASNFVVEPDLTQSLASHIQRLARSITTVEKLNALYVYAQGKLLANPKRVDDIVKPGNLANTLNDFLLSEQKAVPQEEPPAGVTFRADTAEYLRDAAVPQGCDEERALAEVQACYEQSGMSADVFDALVARAIMAVATQTYADGDAWLRRVTEYLDEELQPVRKKQWEHDQFSDSTKTALRTP